jgi:diguanylate cyclase (GGDEF)-like protein/PAS domain S-box-containing protein
VISRLANGRGGFEVNAQNNVFSMDDGTFENLMDHLQEGVYFVDRTRTIQYWNRGAEELTGYHRKDVVGRCCAANILSHVNGEGDVLCTGSCPLVEAMTDGEPRRTEAYLLHRDGQRVPVLIRTSPIRDGAGAIVGALESFTDNTERLAALDRVAALEREALICSLTLVGNRRYSELMLSEKLAERERYNRPFGILFLDIDRFKEINDSYGHVVGDVALKMVAATIRNDMRAADFVGRWGGEEFMVLLETTDRKELEKSANRLRVLVFNTSKQVSKNRIHLTVSVGATLAGPEDTAGTLIERVDCAMYTSKRQGRNLVTIG